MWVDTTYHLVKHGNRPGIARQQKDEIQIMVLGEAGDEDNILHIVRLLNDHERLLAKAWEGGKPDLGTARDVALVQAKLREARKDKEDG